MAYTVKELAKLSGVSVRTLHWYDETGLLKPAFYGDNGYRYYEEEQLLILQQVLFFRELGFNLKDIKKIFKSNDLDKIKALLYTHRLTLENNISRMKKLIKTINKTIKHIEGEKIMEDKEYYVGFDPSQQKEYEIYLTNDYGTVTEELIAESKNPNSDYK